MKYKLTFKYLLTDSSISYAKRDSVCPPDYEQFGKSCYMFHAVPENFDSAQKNCQRHSNGRLVSVTSVYEYGFVRGMTAQVNLNSHWIGLRRSNVSMLFFLNVTRSNSFFLTYISYLFLQL